MPWAEPGSRFTALFERLAIDWMGAASQKAVADQLHLSWNEVHAIQERAVKRGLERRKAEPVARLGVDEKAFKRGHRYFTLVNDLDRGRVLLVGGEAVMAFFGYVYERPARKHFRWWLGWALRSRLKPMADKARMLKRRFDNIVTYLHHRITNAGSESINSKIQWVKYTARGFRNKQNFVTAIYFHCGGLDLMPATH